MLRPSVFLLTLIVFLGCSICHGQVLQGPIITQFPQPADSAQPPKVDPETEKKALDLVATLSEQVVNLHASANRIRAESEVADLLWVRDEKRARTLFTAAVTQLASQIADLDYGDPDVYSEMQRISSSRQELILRIAPHDADLAINALQLTRMQGDNRSRYGGNWTANNEANLEMMLANVIAAKDPAAALKLARTSLSRGVSWNVIAFLPTLYQKDAKSAQTLYKEIVGRIKDDNVSRNAELANNAWNLLVSFEPPQADEDTYRDLLTSMLSYVLASNRQTQPGMNMAQNMYYQIERILPLVDKYAPARSAELREWSQGVEHTLDPSARMYQEMRQISEKGTVDDMLALASKYPPEFQNMLYQNAAWKAVTSGDTARAKEIADKIADPVQRRQVTDQIDNQAARAAEGDNKVVEARRLAEKANTINRKIEILIQSANTIVNTGGEKKAALDLLNEAKATLASTPQSAAELTAQLRLAQAYMRLDTDQAFAILQPVVVRLNDLVAAAVVLDGIDFHYMKDGEWIMPGVNNLGNIVGSLDQILAGLGRIDFDRARTLADQIGRPEMRVLMEIDLVQTTLGVKTPVNQGFGIRGMSGMTIMN
ncbi:MAG TPA: hypothetical protein VK557_02500 [Pyrinomonadaceae bacterium]|nr:hypothetical protein [Pyrinomonadaceae bacterium]